MQEALSELTSLSSAHAFVTTPVSSAIADLQAELRDALIDARARFRPFNDDELATAKRISSNQEAIAMHIGIVHDRAKELEQSGLSLLSPKRHGILAVRNYIEAKASEQFDGSLQTYLSYVLFAQAVVVIFFVFRRPAQASILPFVGALGAPGESRAGKTHSY